MEVRFYVKDSNNVDQLILQGETNTPCLHWYSPINRDTLNTFQPVASHLLNKNLYRITSGRDSGRKDGLFCYHCHNTNKPCVANNCYQPAHNGVTTHYWPTYRVTYQYNIRPTDVINGKTWEEPYGWAQAFSTRPYKTAGAPELQQVVSTYWQDTLRQMYWRSAQWP